MKKAKQGWCAQQGPLAAGWAHEGLSTTTEESEGEYCHNFICKPKNHQGTSAWSTFSLFLGCHSLLFPPKEKYLT